MDINKLVGVVIFIFILMAMAPSIIDLTYTGDCNTGTHNLTYCPFENTSSSVTTVINLLPLMFAVLGLGLVVAYLKLKR